MPKIEPSFTKEEEIQMKYLFELADQRAKFIKEEAGWDWYKALIEDEVYQFIMKQITLIRMNARGIQMNVDAKDAKALEEFAKVMQDINKVMAVPEDMFR